MKYRMPTPLDVRGHNNIQVPSIDIEPEGKKNLREIAEKLIQKMIEISPWHRWSFNAPKEKFLLPGKIKRLAGVLIKRRRYNLEPARLELRIRNGRLLLNTTYWFDSYGRNPRPVEDLQILEQLMEDIAREINREEATPLEVREKITELVIELAGEVISKRIPELEMDFQSTNEATPQEAQEIIRKLAVESWQPKSI